MSGATFSSSWCVRPSTVRTTTPARSSTFRCFEIVGFETPKPPVTTPTVAGPRARRSTIPRRIGWATALNGSLPIWVTISHLDRHGISSPPSSVPHGESPAPGAPLALLLPLDHPGPARPRPPGGRGRYEHARQQTPFGLVPLTCS